MKAALAIIATLLLGTCSQPPTVLEQIMRAGELRVVTRNLPSAYYLRDDVQYFPAGPEFLLSNQERVLEEYRLEQQAINQGLQSPSPLP